MGRLHIKFLFLTLLGCLNIVSCITENHSQNNIIYERQDYEGIRNAILFIKSGGATVGDSYQISILPYQNKLSNSDAGNIFICDSPNLGLTSDTSMIKLNWISYDTLQITYNKKLRVFKAVAKTKDTIVIYDTISLK